MGTPPPLLIACTGYLTLRTRHPSSYRVFFPLATTHPRAPSSLCTFLFFAFSLPSSPPATPPASSPTSPTRNDRASPCTPALHTPTNPIHTHAYKEGATRMNSAEGRRCKRDIPRGRGWWHEGDEVESEPVLILMTPLPTRIHERGANNIYAL